jgi:ureidoglycolate lyase
MLDFLIDHLYEEVNMLKAKIEKLTLESFAPFGYFAKMIDPKAEYVGGAPSEFYRDMLQLDLGQATKASFSICRVTKRPEVVTTTEIHSSCGEGILPLDNDILIHVAPASRNGDIPCEKIQIFSVPKGTMVVLKPGVFHHAPFVAKGEHVSVLIVLPERTYANDCQVFELTDKQKVAIEK